MFLCHLFLKVNVTHRFYSFDIFLNLHFPKEIPMTGLIQVPDSLLFLPLGQSHYFPALGLCKVLPSVSVYTKIIESSFIEHLFMKTPSSIFGKYCTSGHFPWFHLDIRWWAKKEVTTGPQVESKPWWRCQSAPFILQYETNIIPTSCSSSLKPMTPGDPQRWDPTKIF